MAAIPDWGPGEHETPPRLISAQVKTNLPDSSETVTVEMQISGDTWNHLKDIWGEHKWGDEEGLVALMAAGLAVLTTDNVAVNDEAPDQIIERLRKQLISLEVDREALRNRVDGLHVLEWRDLPLAREQLGDCKALIVRLRGELDTLQAENARLRSQIDEARESRGHR